MTTKTIYKNGWNLYKKTTYDKLGNITESVIIKNGFIDSGYHVKNGKKVDYNNHANDGFGDLPDDKDNQQHEVEDDGFGDKN